MAEGAMPGAPNVSGTDEDPSHFFHQPPPVAGVNFGSSPSQSDGIEFDHAISHTEQPPSTPKPPRRLRFPSDDGQLRQTHSAPSIGNNGDGDDGDNDGSGSDGKKEKGGEPDRDPAAHHGWWQSFRDWMTSFKHDFGEPERSQDVQDLMGDIGIDVQTLKSMLRSSKGGKRGRPKGHNRVSSLIAPSVMLARPGLGSRTESTSTVATTATATATAYTSAPDSGASTPGTVTPGKPWRFGVGVDPHEVSHALKKLKSKVAKKDSPQAKYVQAKAELAHRRNVVLLMVYAFMAYGAPSHRIEEYTLKLFSVLEIEGRVNYTVGCTEISFINPIDPQDPMTRTAYTTLVKAQGLDIGACETSFRIYKDVVHGEVTVEEATHALAQLIESPSYYKPWFLVPFYGLASSLACIWAFGGYWLDMPIAFLLGCIVGLLQVVLAAKNPLYANVLEVSASLITSFGARAFSSIGPGQKYFCFGAIAESSICTILPGYIVLCGSLELQSKSITAGSTRLFYAVIYSLLLGYGIDVGAQLWAVIYPDAPTDATCPRVDWVSPKWKILLVPSYLVIQAVLLRSRPRQIPVQVVLGSAAYTVNFFVSQYATAQVADTASAFTLGVLGHLWARSQHAFAFAAVVAGIMVLVPSGLSAQGGLVAGITTPLFNNATTNAQDVYEQNIYQSFSVGAQMIQVAAFSLLD
ncbi:hypothetical protein Daus18300_012808 [Diaporthe australafricana]|uniref:Threonine/serine exporter-like N-terminal domain-containing protein n=1 Tax=Diaporthe australafricana TaxID=127596 RepID=A0ABR3W1A8_9PEZI